IFLGVLTFAATEQNRAKDLWRPEPSVVSSQAALVPVSAANSGPGWSVVSSPNTNDGPLSNAFSAVACTSTVDCWAVGYRDPYSGERKTFVEHWDGNSWSI